MDPESQRYLNKYKEYLEVKTKKDDFVNAIENVKKERWDKYTKGPESPHKKGKELKEMLTPEPAERCEFSVYEAGKGPTLKAEVSISRPGEEAAALKTLKDRDREAFIALRELYNSLDTVFGFSFFCIRIRFQNSDQPQNRMH